jgi:TP901 family phage tail tape measure protein
VAAGERILRVIIAGDALGAVGALEDLSHGLERAHSSADAHGGGIMSSMGGLAKGVGLFAVGAAAAVGGIAAELYKVGSGYEQSLNQIQAFTKSSDAQMKALEQSLYGMSPALAKYGLTVGDAADALSKLTKAGFSLSQGQALLIPTMALSKATTVDAAEAANVMTEAMHSFGLQTKDAQMVSDSFTNATHTSTASLEDLHNALAYSAVVSHHAGLTFNETTGFLAEMANIGIRGSKAGTALKDVLTNLEVPTTKGGAALKALGIDAYDSNGKMKDFTVIVGQLHDKMANLSDQQKNTYIKDIFGKIPLESAKQLVETGIPNYEKYIKVVGRTGEASTIASAKSKGLSGTFSMLSATMESSAQHLYMQVAPKLATFLNPFVEALPGYLSKAAKYGQEIWAALSDPGKAAKGPNGGSGFMKGLVEVGKVVHGDVLPALKEVGQVIVKDVIPMVERVGKVFITQIVPFVARAASDIGRLLLPIIKDIGRFIKTDVLPSLKQWGEFISAVVIPKMETLWTKTQPILKTLADFIEKKVIPLLDWAWKQLQPIFKDFQSLISEALDALAGLYSFLAPVIKWIIDVFGGPLIDAVKGFLSGVFIAVRGAIEFLRGLIEFLRGVFTGNWHAAWDGLCKIIAGAWDFIYGFLKAVLFGKIVKLFVEGGKLLIDAAEAPFKWIASRVESFSSDVTYGFTRLKQVASALWKTLWDDATSLLSSAMKSMSDSVVRIGADILKWFQDLPGALLRLLSEAASWLLKTGGDIVSGLLKGIGDGAKALWKWFTDLPGTAKGYFNDVSTWLEDAGLNMMKGFIKGVEDMAGQVKDSAVGVVKDAYKGVKDFLGINSPSRLYMGLGHGTGEGFINGVVAKTAAVHDAVVGMVTVPANRFTAAFRQQQQTASTAAAVAARNVGQVWATSGAVGPVPAGGFTVPVTINVAGSIQAEKDFARNMSQAIRDEIRQIARRNGGRTGL